MLRRGNRARTSELLLGERETVRCIHDRVSLATIRGSRITRLWFTQLAPREPASALSLLRGRLRLVDSRSGL